MIIESLKLNNFRNYESLYMDFSDSINILYGDNAQGKTNVLEAIYMCSSGKSHRGAKDKETIRFDQEEGHIQLVVKKNEIPYKIDIHLKKNKHKGIAINGLSIKKISEILGVINVIFFSPEDLTIIKNGPSERRRFINTELCQLDSFYTNNLINYTKVINQRNDLLRELGFNYSKDLYETLDVWDMQLIRYGREIIKSRQDFIKTLNEIIPDIHRDITSGKEDIKVSYEPDVTIDDFENNLKSNRERDIKYKNTSVGPHRDDMAFFVKGKDLRHFGSQGQQRTAALSLKLSEIEITKMITKETPVLLLDDVMSELDSSRQNKLLERINGIQTVITCTGIEEFIRNRVQIDRIYSVVDGTASLMKSYDGKE